VQCNNSNFVSVMLVCLAGVFCLARAHTPLLFLEDNGDGTLYVQAGLSTGESAGGSKVFIREKETGRPLITITMPDSGKINVPMPKVPYTVTLDMGPGHIVTKTGPLKGEARMSDSAATASASHKKNPTGWITIIAVLAVVMLSGRWFAPRRKARK
jgi:hypothetical protein